MIHENSMSPESAIQGTAGEGPRGKTQLNMDKVRGGLKTQIKQRSAFLSVHSGVTSASIFTLSYCAHPSSSCQPSACRSGCDPGQQGSSARAVPPPG